MVDRARVLAKLDEIDGYLSELDAIRPSTLEEYRTVEKRRACERLGQVAVEAALDVCALLVSGLRLGLPGDENDFFEKLVRAGVLSEAMGETLRRMKGCRNILAHEYGRVADEIIFEVVTSGVRDFAAFRAEVVSALGRA